MRRGRPPEKVSGDRYPEQRVRGRRRLRSGWFPPLELRIGDELGGKPGVTAGSNPSSFNFGRLVDDVLNAKLVELDLLLR